MTRIFAVAVLMLGACTQPETVFTSEASDSHWEREFVSRLVRHHRLNLIRLKRDVDH